ncbi:MAG: type IV pilin N-terminal domain-containing protein [Methanofollis liminatans]|jgi:FlaG/FlaF family flagellin (archaellin)|nr:type IV pilin N-terminal domain-containing protein [Methanofollis liminatans]
MNGERQRDEAVSSVMGEMIMIALVIILVALFATSAFSLIPGGRETSVDVVMKNGLDGTPVEGDTMVIFWHKGGDWVEDKDLTVVVIGEDGGRKEYDSKNPAFCLYDHAGGSGTKAFDLGGRLEVTPLDPSLKKGDIVRLITQKNVIYSGDIP